MNFYEEMVKSSKEVVFQVAVEKCTKRVDVEDTHQFAGLVLDFAFDEFRKSAGWPIDRLHFTNPEKTNEFRSTPSEAMVETKDGVYGVCARFQIGEKRIDELITFREIDNDRSELAIGEDVLPIRWTDMPCCPPFTSGIVVSVLATHVIKGRLVNRVHE